MAPTGTGKVGFGQLSPVIPWSHRNLTHRSCISASIQRGPDPGYGKKLVTQE